MEHMLLLCKMDLLMQRERIKERVKKRIKTNQEYHHSKLISLLGQYLRSFTTLLKNQSVLPSERRGYRKRRGGASGREGRVMSFS